MILRWTRAGWRKTPARSAASPRTRWACSTLFTGTDEEFGKLSDTILDLSSATGLAADGLAEAAYSALSASVPAEDLGFTLEKSAKLAAAGFTDVDTALSATAKTMNAYGMSGE